MTARARRGGRWLLLAAGLWAALQFGAPPAAADTDDFTFDSFHADMGLSRGADGHAELAVVETIVARFPEEDQNRGIIRAIPDDDGGVPLHTDIVSVASGSGEPLPFEVEEDDGFLEVAIGDDSYVRGEQVYVITYTQRDSIRAFDDTRADEFYRDLNGTGWKQPFGSVSAAITIDPELTDALTGDSACYVGAEGSTEACTIVERGPSPGAGKQFYPQATGLDPGENVTIAIGFEPNTFVPGEVERSPLEEFAIGAAPGIQAGLVATSLAALAAAALALVARRRSRDAAGRGVIVAQYDPPRAISVIQAAHLVGRPANAVPAAIIDLAVGGHARIISHHGDAAVISVEYVSPSPDDAARQQTLDALFGLSPEPGRRMRLGVSTPAEAARFTALSAAAIGELRAAGYTRKRSHALPATAFGVALTAFLVALAGAILSAITGAPLWVPAIAFAVTVVAGAVSTVAWRAGDRVTEDGAPIRDHLIGLRDYLQLAEADRIRMLQSPEGAERSGPETAAVLHLYERLLPYAMIWGIETEWAQVVETQARSADAELDWYHGPQAFSGAQFVGVLAASRVTTAPAWASSGGSSFSGGSMGGGFSGGGAGGGGGGGR